MTKEEAIKYLTKLQESDPWEPQINKYVFKALGEDWYVVDPVSQTQVNEIALYEILEKYSKRYRKECKGKK